MTKPKSSGLTMPLAERTMITAKALSCWKWRNVCLRGVVSAAAPVVVVLDFNDAAVSSCCLKEASSSFGRLMSPHVGPTPPDIFGFLRSGLCFFPGK